MAINLCTIRWFNDSVGLPKSASKDDPQDGFHRTSLYAVMSKKPWTLSTQSCWMVRYNIVLLLNVSALLWVPPSFFCGSHWLMFSQQLLLFPFWWKNVKHNWTRNVSLSHFSCGSGVAFLYQSNLLHIGVVNLCKFLFLHQIFTL